MTALGQSFHSGVLELSRVGKKIEGEKMLALGRKRF